MADYVTPAQLARQLGMRDPTVLDPGTVVGERLAAVCVAASDAIDGWLHRDLPDSTGVPPGRFDPVPARVGQVALAAGVDYWKQPDAGFGIIGTNDTGAVRIPRDIMRRYSADLIGFMSLTTEGIG